MAKARHERFDCSPGCAVEAALQFIDGKWKGVILYHLLDGTMRFNAIRTLGSDETSLGREAMITKIYWATWHREKPFGHSTWCCCG